VVGGPDLDLADADRQQAPRPAERVVRRRDVDVVEPDLHVAGTGVGQGQPAVVADGVAVRLPTVERDTDPSRRRGGQGAVDDEPHTVDEDGAVEPDAQPRPVVARGRDPPRPPVAVER
jgi:hypothetical protein